MTTTLSTTYRTTRRIPRRHDADFGLSSAEVMTATGITYRQLDYWTRIGIIPDGYILRGRTPGSGSERLFDHDVIFWIMEHLAKIDACPRCGQHDDD